jgi:Bifunctional DNA primase/polymerase, N-terminal
MNDNIYATIILDYINHGFSSIPIPYQSKTPLIKGWNKLTVTADNLETYFDGTETNIAIWTGKPSGGLVDINIDDPAALKFAAYFLPQTNCIFGHKSKPRSHWVYRVPNPKAVAKFIGDGMILEIRGNNRCTVFPGSIHANGEPIEFDNPDNYEPSTSTWRQLKRVASKIAIATELGKFWLPGNRHELTLYTSAMLVRLGWRSAEVSDLIRAIATEANDEELQDRLTAVETTFSAYAHGKEIFGEERFIQLVGQDVAEDIHKWACSPEGLKQLAMAPSPILKPISATLADLSHDSSAVRPNWDAYEDEVIASQRATLLVSQK